jgi:hypothetical protein
MKKYLIVVILALAFLLSSGCSPKDEPPEATAEITPSPEVSPGGEEPSPSPELSPEPTEKIPDENIKVGYNKDITAVIDGAEETVKAVKYSASFGEEADAPEFEFYFDLEKFDTEPSDTKFRFIPLAEDAAPVTFMEIGFVPELSPTELMPSFIDAYIDFMDVEFTNYSSFGKNDVSSQKIIASNFAQYAEAYLVEAGNGTVYCVFSSTEKNDEYIAWFTAMCETISIK